MICKTGENRVNETQNGRELVHGYPVMSQYWTEAELKELGAYYARLRERAQENRTQMGDREGELGTTWDAERTV